MQMSNTRRLITILWSIFLILCQEHLILRKITEKMRPAQCMELRNWLINIQGRETFVKHIHSHLGISSGKKNGDFRGLRMCIQFFFFFFFGRSVCLCTLTDCTVASTAHQCHTWLSVIGGKSYFANQQHLHSPYLAWEDGEPMTDRLCRSPHRTPPPDPNPTHAHTDGLEQWRGRGIGAAAS